MTIELSLLISGISVAFAIFFGIRDQTRNSRKDTKEEKCVQDTNFSPDDWPQAWEDA